MRAVEPPFSLDFGDNLIRVAEHELNGKRVFHIDFNGVHKALVITVAVTRSNKKVWTSIPEGRQAEAEQIGKLIASYIRNKK